MPLQYIAGNNAILTLPTPGSANSLGAMKNMIISTIKVETTKANNSSTRSHNFRFKNGKNIGVKNARQIRN